MSASLDVFVSGHFDNLRSPQIRLLEEAARLGPVHVLLWSDAAVQRIEGRPAKFPEAERRYFLGAIRYVDRVTICDDVPSRDALPGAASPTGIWVVAESDDSEAKRTFGKSQGLRYHVIEQGMLDQFPASSLEPVPTLRKRVLVTGCYDWFHSGHIRFFEEVSEYGDLYVVVGHDANIELLKGKGHPLFREDERRYLAQSIRYVTQGLISTGHGWLDAEPELLRIKPDIYAVNEDGDRPEKRSYCESHGIEYLVLKRVPKEGLPRRQSTDLRGF